MLRLAGDQVESLLDELLPVEVRELPGDLAVLDRLLADPRLLAPITQAWERSARGHGRPTIPMASFVRLMVIEQRTGWGYETLVREVSDSLHLRRFCLLPLTARASDESTVRKLVRRLGPETVNQLTRVVIGTAQRETRFAARAVRIDATVVDADIRYPTDGVLAWQGARALARQGRKLAGRLRGQTRRVVDRSRRIGKLVRAISKTLSRRTGQRVEEVLELNAKAGQAMAGWVREAWALAVQHARPRVGAAPGPSCAPLSSWRSSLTVASGSSPRSSSDPVARRSLTGWCRWPTRTLARSARASWASPTSSAMWCRSLRSPPTPVAAPAAMSCRRPAHLAIRVRTACSARPWPSWTAWAFDPGEVALDGGFVPGPTTQVLAGLAPTRTFISGRAEPGSRRTRKRLARYRTGCEGRISHLKRGYGLRRSRLKGDQGQRIWTGWAVLAYNLDTLAIHTA
jgi:IS5 family transposase